METNTSAKVQIECEIAKAAREGRAESYAALREMFKHSPEYSEVLEQKPASVTAALRRAKRAREEAETAADKKRLRRAS